MAAERIPTTSVAENVLQRDEKTLGEIKIASRKEKEASLRRYEAGAWLRKMVGVVVGKDLPAQPSEDEFRLGLRSGIILCKVLNKVKPHSVPKVVEAPGDSILIPDGEALSAYKYFENVRNFLVSVKEMGLPTFETCDLEKGGKSRRIVNCVLALKSYKEAGGSVLGKLGESPKLASSPEQVARKIADLFSSSHSRSSLSRVMSTDSFASEVSLSSDAGLGNYGSLSTIVQELLVDKENEDIPPIVENILSKVMEEFEHRLALQKEQMDQLLRLQKEQMEQLLMLQKEQQRVNEPTSTNEEESCNSEKDIQNNHMKCQSERQQMLAEQHQRDIQELKNVLNAAKTDMHLLKTTYEEEVSNLGKHFNGLTGVLEENRKLYNLVQDLKGNIRVYCRVRPFLPGQVDDVNCVDHLDDDGSITVTEPSKIENYKKQSFTFNKVFGPSATQEEIYAETKPLVRSVLDGYNVCIFAYGQTGSGKTHTMTGPNDLTKETMGVNYRALSDLFLISEQRKDLSAYDISVQMIEIYNEEVRDLLVTDGTNKKLEIRDNSPNGINVPDANIVPVTSPSDVINLMNLGPDNRAVCSTDMNDRSSRSHSCLTVHVEGRDLTSGTILRGCMHLVDLAGSDRLGENEAVGDRLNEAQHINKSLSALGDVIVSLAQKNDHVPYMNSKLTQLLQDSLGGQAKTLMFIHISPEPDAIGETLSTLKFAERVSSVDLGAAKSNKESSELRELKEQNASLKAALERRDVKMECSPYSSSTERVRMKTSASSSPSHDSLQSYDGLSDRRQSMGGSSDRRQSIGGSSDRRQSLSGSSDRRQSMGGSSDRRQSMGGSSDRRQSIGGLSDRRQSMGGSSDRRQSMGGSSDRRQSKDGSESIEVRSNSSEKMEMKSLDLQDLVSWPAIGNPLPRGDDRDLVPGDWVEKVMVNKSDPKRGGSSQGRWENENGMPTNIHRSSSIPTSFGTKVKKTPPKSQDTRSSIPSPHGRKATNGTNSTRSIRSASYDGRRKTSSGK